MIKIKFNNSYANLSNAFYKKTTPTLVKKPELIKFNQALASDLGLTEIAMDKSSIASQSEAAEVFSGNRIMEGSEPLSMVYAGHQFGGFSPQLGDGRAILLGEVINPEGVRFDIQLKGSGPTIYSRSGDGRSALGPVIREYLVSEAMAKLGVPTTRALAMVTTGEEVARDTLVPGGILTRVATGFVRVGTFEYFSAQGNLKAVQELADYEIARHFSQNKTNKKDSGNAYVEFFSEVVDRQAKLIAKWMSLGFIHGVMNTDNMSIVGETIDYGPCAFMDAFDYNRVYSSVDRNGRYAYSNQPKIGQWNLVRLAETLLPLFIENSFTEKKLIDPSGTNPTEQEKEKAVEIAQNILNGFATLYTDYWLSEMQKKLGLSEQKEQQNLNDNALVGELLDLMDSTKADFTLVFSNLTELLPNQDDAKQLKKIRALFSNADAFDAWLIKWQARLAEESTNHHQRQKEQLAIMRKANPVYIPRNHQIEAAIRAAEDHNDFSVFNALHEVLQNPFEYQTGKDDYLLPPKPEEMVHQTFCGT